MKELSKITCIVNGKEITINVLPGETLAELLRERLGLTGTKIGCNELECGACTVIIDGEAILSCSYPALRANGKNIVTIEGLSQTHPQGKYHLHPLQEAFVKHGAVQCGFCIPGVLMTSAALLDKNPDPKSEEIRFALKDTLCRCAGYQTIENAVLAAARAKRTGEPVEEPIIPLPENPKDVIGKIIHRPEAIEKVTGQALFTDDLKFDGMIFGRAKRAGVAHAKVISIDIENAKKLEGVHAVLTAIDIPGAHYHGVMAKDWPTLVGIGEKVRYVGDAVALVAADSYEIASQALALIEVEYEMLEVIEDPVSALKNNNTKIHESGNLLKHIKVRKGDTRESFNKADLVLEHTFKTVSTDHAFMETECSIARLTDDDRIEVFVGSQIPYEDREMVAAALNWPLDRVRIRGMLIGGGFGGKEDIMGQIHAALLCVKTEKPVKILYERQESLVVDTKRHATQIKIKAGVKNDGTLVAVETELFGDTGAYASLGEVVMTRATTHSSGPYEIESVKGDCYAMFTNNPPAGAFRGFGVTQSAFAVESMMDMVAEKLNLNPIDFRIKNSLSVGSITNTGQILHESVGLVECIQKVKQKIYEFDSDPFRFKVDERNGLLRRAWGIAAAYKNTGLGGGAPDQSSAEVEILDDGSVEVRTSAAEIGQGLVTVLQMTVAEEMHFSIDKVKVLLSDTDLTPDGGPTTASRQTYVTGNAARKAAQKLLEKIRRQISEFFNCDQTEIDFSQGKISLLNQIIEWTDLVSEFKRKGLTTKETYKYSAPNTVPLGEKGDMHFTFSYAVQAAEVEVNTKTGEVRVLRVIAANDVGKALNPLGLQVQVEGGVMMGLGNALTETFIVDKGQVVTDKLAMYRIPSIDQTPEIYSIIVESPTSEGPYGAKGVGEVVSIPTTPAITNAIYNAVGVRIDQLPVDQEFIAKEIQKLEGE
jgi:xanthine dehydrogenase molybdenum-binding subunit